MKKIFFTSCLTMLSIFSYAQSQFEMKLTENTAKLEKATTAADFDILFSEFSSLIKFNDKNKWKAYYYAGFTQYKKADMLLNSNSFAEAKESNAIAFKYLKVVVDKMTLNKEAQQLLDKIEEQKLRITSN